MPPSQLNDQTWRGAPLSSISVLNLCLSFRATARCAAGRALISSTSRFRLGNFVHISSPRTVGISRTPAPDSHINDSVGIAQHVVPLGQARVENAEMALCFIHVPTIVSVANGGCPNGIQPCNRAIGSWNDQNENTDNASRAGYIRGREFPPGVIKLWKQRLGGAN